MAFGKEKSAGDTPQRAPVAAGVAPAPANPPPKAAAKSAPTHENVRVCFPRIQGREKTNSIKFEGKDIAQQTFQLRTYRYPTDRECIIPREVIEMAKAEGIIVIEIEP